MLLFLALGVGWALAGVAIDRAIIRDIDRSPGNQTFLRGLCTIAHTMGMTTMAEGVNTADEARVLKELGL